jgi:hypothetical protein
MGNDLVASVDFRILGCHIFFVLPDFMNVHWLIKYGSEDGPKSIAIFAHINF